MDSTIELLAQTTHTAVLHLTSAHLDDTIASLIITSVDTTDRITGREIGSFPLYLSPPSPFSKWFTSASQTPLLPLVYPHSLKDMKF
jgi:hypothetical protein